MNKYNISFAIVLLSSLLFITSCERKSHLPDIKEGVNLRLIADATTTFIDAANLEDARLIIHGYSESTNINKIELYVQYYKAADDVLTSRALIKSYTGGDINNQRLPDIIISTADIANVSGVPVSEMQPGDRVDFLVFVTTNDGTVYPSTVQINPQVPPVNNITPSIANGSASSFTSKLTFFLACSFVADDAVGTYLIVRDDFEASLDLSSPIVAEKISDTEIVFRDLFKHPQKYDVIVRVTNIASGAATVPQQPAWHCDNFGCAYGEGRVAGTGVFFSCSGFLSVDLAHTVDAGSFGVFRLELKKQ